MTTLTSLMISLLGNKKLIHLTRFLQGFWKILPKLELYTDDTGDAEKVIIIAMYHLTLLELYNNKLAKFPHLLIIDTPRQ